MSIIVLDNHRIKGGPTAIMLLLLLLEGLLLVLALVDPILFIAGVQSTVAHAVGRATLHILQQTPDAAAVVTTAAGAARR